MGNQKGTKVTVPTKSIPIGSNNVIRNMIYIPPPVNLSVESTSSGSSISPDNHMGEVFTSFQTQMYSLRQFKSGSNNGGSDISVGRRNIPLSSSNGSSNDSSKDVHTSSSNNTGTYSSSNNSEDSNSNSSDHNMSVGVSAAHVQDVTAKVIQTGEFAAI